MKWNGMKGFGRNMKISKKQKKEEKKKKRWQKKIAKPVIQSDTN